MAELKNVKQEKFVQGLLSGLSQRKAYRAAYPNSEKWKDATVDARASALFKTDKVYIRYSELQQQATNEAVKSATKRKEWLSQVMDNEREEMQHRLKACDMLNRMDDAYTDGEEKRARIDKLKAETARIKGENPESDEADDGFIEALQGEVKNLWQE